MQKHADGKLAWPEKRGIQRLQSKVIIIKTGLKSLQLAIFRIQSSYLPTLTLA